MKIGVLQAGLVPEELSPEFGEYDRVFVELVKRADPSVGIEGWRVVEGEFPPSPDAADGWIVSGSKHGVYEDHEWIPPLKAFIRAAAEMKRPMVGVCFGHQIMAEALGGRAMKSEKGWGLGPYNYDVVAKPSWMSATPDRLHIAAVHQDQVTELAPDATRIATCSFCENAALAYGDPEHPYAISIQPHPEFTRKFTRHLIETRMGAAFPEELSETALERLDTAEAFDADWAARWFMDFFELHIK